ncbi:STAS/SEC14 domain-containing protein [Primorskyibacter sp. 2E233]|uniref:STAS/SEC14 domain-containing protein n=1 Tax=Primorskyibacter sp. 2E233 TaxID=3413431 RepID=UPI003BF29000
MIKVTAASHPGVYEVEVSGRVTEDDYENVLIPALETVIENHDHIRLLVKLDKGFESFSLGAVMDDAKMGLKHWNGFDRIALVAEKGWITGMVRAFSILMPCPVQIFPLSHEEEARRWLVESLGAIHQTDLGGGVLLVQLHGKLDPEVYESETEDMNAFVRANDRFRLLLDLRDFDGWQGLAAINRHLSLVRDHIGVLDKAAIIGDAAWQKLAERILSKAADAETEYFTADQFEAAKRWIAA